MMLAGKSVFIFFKNKALGRVAQGGTWNILGGDRGKAPDPERLQRAKQKLIYQRFDSNNNLISDKV
jgi:hypothetical protein